jgi:hypothetical protein
MHKGVVMRSVAQRRRHLELGRVQLNSVSDAYLLRRDGTEYL